jgi:signal transduction histidine kinase
VREMLAASLGDHSVNIVYWLPDRETFVDESGRKVEMPEPGSGRAWTAVEQDGRRVAAIVHDVALDTSPELVHAAAAASSLAIDNERLKADLRARLEELRVSRLRIVEAADAARRRIERDLHDGAQQQLVSLSLQLRVLKARLKSDPELQDLVDQLSDQLARALEELRELARGIHPAVLTDHGLGPAIAALADRVPIDVDSQLSTDERMPAPVEAAAYFVVAEALTNVVKYAEASRAIVDIRRRNDDLWVTVSDDGVGGASIGAGSGLRGLQDRVAAVGGTLTVASAPGRGTRLTARLPCAEPAATPAAAEQDESVVGA